MKLADKFCSNQFLLRNSFIYFLMCMENALRQIIPPTAGRKMKSANQIRAVMSKGDQKNAQ
ncbi:hypothetical protein CBR65_18590 [Cellvibrio sp. PSBB006]|nr:hypothetical protein CBR65_18590 [Cellvibrio sp. PSBB006]